MTRRGHTPYPPRKPKIHGAVPSLEPGAFTAKPHFRFRQLGAPKPLSQRTNILLTSSLVVLRPNSEEPDALVVFDPRANFDQYFQSQSYPIIDALLFAIMPDPTNNRTPAEAEQGILLDQMRRTIVENELHILALDDKISGLQSTHADAVALLGQAELLLEQKVGYILELDRSLTARIRELEQECDRKSAEIDRRGEALEHTRREADRQRQERDHIIADLSRRLDQANQETSRAHDLAGGFAEKLELEKQAHAAESAQRAMVATQLDSARSELAERQRALENADLAIKQLNANLTQQTLHSEQQEAALNETRSTLRTIKDSALWKLSRPWRALFGPKV